MEFWQENISGNQTWDCFLRNPNEKSLKKRWYITRVFLIYTPLQVLSLVEGSQFFHETRLQLLLSLTPFRFTIYKSLVLQKHKETKIESNEYLNNITICLVQ